MKLILKETDAPLGAALSKRPLPAVGKPPLRERDFETVMNAISPTVPKTSVEFSAALCLFINSELPLLHPKMVAEPGVTAETPLFATGLIDSMAILHVIAFVEDATGRDILPEQVVMKHFATVAAITETFCSANVSS